MTMESLLIILIIGAIAGWLASVIMKGGGLGLLGDIVVGIVGAFVGSFVLDQCLLGIVQTLLNRLTRERNVLFRALKRDPSLRSAGSDMAISAAALVPAVLIGTAVETLAAAAGRGGALVVVARPTGAAA